MSSAREETKRGMVLERHHPPSSSSSSSSPSSLLKELAPSASPTQVLPSSHLSLLSRPSEIKKDTSQRIYNTRMNKYIPSTTNKKSSVSSLTQRLSSLSLSSPSSKSISSSPKFVFSPPLSSVKPPSLSKYSTETTRTPTNNQANRNVSSPSILRKPTQKPLTANITLSSKRVKFKPSYATSKTNVGSKIKKNVCFPTCQNNPSLEPFAQQHPLRISSHYVEAATKTEYASTTPVLTKLIINTTCDQYTSENITTKTTVTTSNAQQKFSWDESLQQLSKGLKNICGSPEAFALKSFKRASSLSADSRRQKITSPHLSPHRLAQPNPLTLPKNLLKSGFKPQRNLDSMLSSPHRQSSHSPTTNVSSTHDEDFYAFLPVELTTVQPLQRAQEKDILHDLEVSILDLKSLSNEDSKYHQSNPNINALHSTPQNVRDGESIMNIASSPTNVHNKRVHTKKQNSMYMENTEQAVHSANILTFLPFNSPRKLTVRHEESFQSLETELRRLLFSSGDEKINGKLTTSSNGLPGSMEKIDGKDKPIIDGRKKERTDKFRNTRQKCDPYPEVWKDEEEEDELGFINEDYSTLLKVSLSTSGVRLEDIYAEVFKDRRIVVGVLKDICEQACDNVTQCKQVVGKNYEKVILEEFKGVNKAPSDLICTLSRGIKWLFVKEKKTKIQENDYNCCNATHNLNNDKQFVSFSEALSGVYLPIIVHRSTPLDRFLSIFLKLPDELQCESLSVKRIDESVLISGYKGRCETSPLKNSLLEDYKNIHETRSIKNDTEQCEPISNSYNVSNLNQNQSSILCKNNIATSNQIENYATPESSSNHELFKQLISTTPLNTPSNSPSNSPSNPLTKGIFNQSIRPPSYHPTKALSSQTPDFFASFSLPCNAQLRSTAALLTHHHVLSITVPLHTDLQRRFSF